MRTTLNLDKDVFEVARAIASAERRSIGDVVSELARRGLASPAPAFEEEDGFPVFGVGKGAPLLTSEKVRAALEDF